MELLMTSIVDLKKSQHNRPHEFVKYLSKKHNITILSINDWWKGRQENHEEYASDFDDIFENIDYHYITNSKKAPILQEFSFSKKMKKLSKMNFDIHFNYNSLICGYRFSNKFKTVFDIADDLPAMIRHSPQIPRLLKYFASRLGLFYLNKNMKNAEYVTLTTKSLAHKISGNKVKVIPNGVDTKNFRPYNKMKEKLGLTGFIIGYVGVLREWVDLRPIFRILGQLNKEIKLLVVGKEGQYKENVKLAKKYGVTDRVIFTGTIPYSKVPEYISAMDICLIPFALNDISSSALPLKLFEYMACKKPIVSTPISAIKKVAGNNVLYATTNDQYKDQINLLYEDNKLRNKLGRKGRKISEDYSWEKIAVQLDKLLMKTAYGFDKTVLEHHSSEFYKLSEYMNK